jgi:hypothetical protein
MIFAVEHLQRSGGHAVINWLLSHYQNYRFMNNLMPKKQPKVTTKRGNGKHLLYSLENRTSDFTKNEPDKRIIILRDPLNWAASIIRRRGNMSFYKDDKLIRDQVCLDFYKEYYRKYKSDEFYGINYNKWFTSSEYRREIEKDFNLSESDKGINAVLNFGSGSSFDGNKFNGKAQQMKTLERWHKYKNHPIIKKIQNDEEFIEILKEFDL